MSYSQFTIDKVKQDFGLKTVEGVRFLPDSLELIPPSSRLQGILEDLPWAIAVDTEKARSEVIINPVLLEVRRILNKEISVFSGEEFNIDASVGLNGVCDFLISRFPRTINCRSTCNCNCRSEKIRLKIWNWTMYFRNGSRTTI